MNVALPGASGISVRLLSVLRAVAFVEVEVAVLLDEDAAHSAGQRAHRQVIGERPGRHEDRALLAEQARAPIFQFLDDAAERVRVRRHRLLVEQTGEK